MTADDEEAVRFLYPLATVTVTGTVSTSTAGNPTGATVSIAGTVLSDLDIDDTGLYSISGVPNNVTYDITATLGGDSQTVRVTVDSAVPPSLTQDLIIDVSGGDDGGDGGGGGGGGGPPCEKFITHPKC